MVNTQLGAILRDLEPFFHIKLEPDQNNACLVSLPMGIKVQMELTRSGDFLAAVKLGVIPSSRYRELVFREALKSNAVTAPSEGVFGYSSRSNNLFYFVIVDSRNISPEKITSLLPNFLAKAKQWADEIARGAVPVAESSHTSSQGLFGLRH